MAEHPQEQVAAGLRRGGEFQQRPGQCLVHGLVEAGQFLHLGRAQRRRGTEPQADHRGAQGAVLGRGLADIEAAGRAQGTVGLGRGIRRTGRMALGLLRALALVLRQLHVRGHGDQDLVDVVAQRGPVHVLGGGPQRPRERFALVHDAGVVGGDEVRQASGHGEASGGRLG